MADVSSDYLSKSRNNRGRGKEKYTDFKQGTYPKEYDMENGSRHEPTTNSRNDSTSKDSKYQYDRADGKSEERNIRFSKPSEDRRVMYRADEKNHRTSPPSHRYNNHELTKDDFRNTSYNDDRFRDSRPANNSQYRSPYNADHSNDRKSGNERFVSYNNRKSAVSKDEEFVASLWQKIDYLSNQVEFLSQENEKLKWDFNSMSNNVHGNSNGEVNISFQNKSLEEKFLPLLEELVSDLISENLSLEELQSFVSSKKYSAEESETCNELPEGDLFALDASFVEPNENSPVPKYETSFSEILQDPDLMSQTVKSKSDGKNKKMCFNCSENHVITKCPYQIDQRKVAIAKKQRPRPIYVQSVRYHVLGIKEADFKPGVISDELRKALGLQQDQIPPYIYRMRLLNYPPGWLEEAAVESSGITLYGTDGYVQKDEDGESNNLGTQVQYDPDKLVDFPGFNVPLPPHFVDECYQLRLPSMQAHHLRSVVEQTMPKLNVRPKRKRKSASANSQLTKVQRLDEDMDIDDDSDEDVLEFNPPLPEENPPPPPPPPEDELLLPPGTHDRNQSPPVYDVESGSDSPSSDSIMEAHLDSPSLKELEEIKKRLVMELGTVADDCSNPSSSDGCLLNPYDAEKDDSKHSNLLNFADACVSLDKSNDPSSFTDCNLDAVVLQSSKKHQRTESNGSRSIHVSLGTPSLSRHSSFNKLPDYDNFSKNVTTHLNFENLPNSTGTYARMKKVLKTVKEKINSFMQ